jgi:hypothetical protein
LEVYVFFRRVRRRLLETVDVEVVKPDNPHQPAANPRDRYPVFIAVDPRVREFDDERGSRQSPLPAVPLKTELPQGRSTRGCEIADEI